MLDINDATATEFTFIAVAFIHNEQQSLYDFALTSLYEIHAQHMFNPP